MFCRTSWYLYRTMTRGSNLRRDPKATSEIHEFLTKYINCKKANAIETLMQM